MIVNRWMNKYDLMNERLNVIKWMNECEWINVNE